MCGKEREAKGVGQWRKTLRRCIGKRDRIWGDYVFKWKKADLASDTHVKLWKEE